MSHVAGLWMLLLTVFAAPGRVHAGGLPVCPQAIKVLQQAQDLPAPWQATERGATDLRPLRTVSFFDGPLERGFELKPQRIDGPSKDGSRTIAHRYTFSPEHAAGLTVVCGYQDTSIAVHRMLPVVPGACKVTMMAVGPAKDRTRVECD